MKYRDNILLPLFVAFILISAKTSAQSYLASNYEAEKKEPVNTIFLLPNVYPAVIMNGDTIACMWLDEYIKYSPIIFRNSIDRDKYYKLIRDVKKTLPYAKRISQIIIETYDYMETLPDEKSRQKHLEAMEKELKREYTPQMKKLTRSQGQLLMKLVDRETNSSSYYIVEAFMGSFKAWTYNMFAKLFNNDLKIRYDPYGEDRLTEMVCILVEQGAV